MLGKMSTGRRESETRPRTVIPSDTIRIRIGFLRASLVSHMGLGVCFRRTGAGGRVCWGRTAVARRALLAGDRDQRTVGDEVDAGGDDALGAAQPLDDLEPVAAVEAHLERHLPGLG